MAWWLQLLKLPGSAWGITRDRIRAEGRRKSTSRFIDRAYVALDTLEATVIEQDSRSSEILQGYANPALINEPLEVRKLDKKAWQFLSDHSLSYHLSAVKKQIEGLAASKVLKYYKAGSVQSEIRLLEAAVKRYEVAIGHSRGHYHMASQLCTPVHTQPRTTIIQPDPLLQSLASFSTLNAPLTEAEQVQVLLAEDNFSLCEIVGVIWTYVEAGGHSGETDAVRKQDIASLAKVVLRNYDHEASIAVIEHIGLVRTRLMELQLEC